MSEHEFRTPGTWKVTSQPGGDDSGMVDDCATIEDAAETTIIAEVSGGIGFAEQNANAKLIAAAPALLEALAGAATALHDLANPASRSAHSMKLGRQNAKRHESLVRAAISEATE